jgi:holo-ACP synthase / triphosphoribosyl-dephospho-CoA synthase
MNISEEILKDRERRSLFIKDCLDRYQTVVSLRPNIPGTDKNNYLGYLLINAFSCLVHSFDFEEYKYQTNSDGPYVTFMSNKIDGETMKKEMILLEENHPIGRFIDIDVYNKTEGFSRKQKRKCFICGNEVIECMRNQNHSFLELMLVIEESVFNYYQESLKKIINESILAELELDPKFGLVTPTTSGSHQDMNYNLMIEAKKAIIPYLLEMFRLAAKATDLKSLIPQLRKVGVEAEKSMLAVTEGINAYKGLIFNLGLVVSALGYKLSRFSDANIFDISSEFGKILWSDYQFDSESFGDEAYRNYQILGIKGETLSGFVHVKEALKTLSDLSSEARLKTLVYFIAHIEDTNLLKRAKSIQRYRDVKERFLNLDLSNKEEVERLNEYCIENNLSFGGSADLLVIAVFIKKIKSFFLSFSKE